MSSYLRAKSARIRAAFLQQEPRSYRDLPLRLAQYGCCHRYDQSGELFGLMRVRSLNMNDAHTYCTEEQFAEAEKAKVHTMLVIGGRDLEAGNVSIRLHKGGPQGAKPKSEVVADILQAIQERRG